MWPFDNEHEKLLKHALLNFLAAAVVVILGCIFWQLEQYMATKKMPEYLVIGCHLIAIVLFVTDAIIVMFTAIVLGYKLLKGILKK